MFLEDKREDKEQDDKFEVTLANEPQVQKLPVKSNENRALQDSLKQKILNYQQCSHMYKYLKDSKIKQSEVIIHLPDQLHAKYIIKSITYLADEWITLKTSYIKQGETLHAIVVQLDHISEDQIANMCAELNECIDHFIARGT